MPDLHKEAMEAASEKVPVEKGQWREATVAVWAVYEPHPRRKGFWVVISSEFPYHVYVVGRRELEPMPLTRRTYFGPGKSHPGVRYRESLMKAFRT